jgi:hypothetical protein
LGFGERLKTPHCKNVTSYEEENIAYGRKPEEKRPL